MSGSSIGSGSIPLVITSQTYVRHLPEGKIGQHQQQSRTIEDIKRDLVVAENQLTEMNAGVGAKKDQPKAAGAAAARKGSITNMFARKSKEDSEQTKFQELKDHRDRLFIELGQAETKQRTAGLLSVSQAQLTAVPLLKIVNTGPKGYAIASKLNSKHAPALSYLVQELMAKQRIAMQHDETTKAWTFTIKDPKTQMDKDFVIPAVAKDVSDIEDERTIDSALLRALIKHHEAIDIGHSHVNRDMLESLMALVDELDREGKLTAFKERLAEALKNTPPVVDRTKRNLNAEAADVALMKRVLARVNLINQDPSDYTISGYDKDEKGKIIAIDYTVTSEHAEPITKSLVLSKDDKTWVETVALEGGETAYKYYNLDLNVASIFRDVEGKLVEVTDFDKVFESMVVQPQEIGSISGNKFYMVAGLQSDDLYVKTANNELHKIVAAKWPTIFYMDNQGKRKNIEFDIDLSGLDEKGKNIVAMLKNIAPTSPTRGAGR